MQIDSSAKLPKLVVASVDSKKKLTRRKIVLKPEKSA